MNKDYGTFRASKKFMDSLKLKQKTIHEELCRRAGYRVQKPSLVSVQRYLSLELRRKTLYFNLKNWEKAINETKKIQK
ncbi:MAG: hypothetical protein U9Q99_00015 [Nanoarchaeota archaeon]|nr:hypothetical protein [Nanoarchaeota archaeon]